MAANLPLLGDIGNEYEAGLETNREWNMVFFFHGVHLLFAMGAAFCVAYTNRILAAGGAMERAERDEAVFLSTRYIGIFCGSLGLVVFALLAMSGQPVRYLSRIVGALGTVIIAPYALAAGIWLFLQRGERLREWIDEKQFLDVAKAALVTILFVFPLLWIVYLFQPPVLAAAVIPHLWFPISACLALFVFSSAVVWFSRRA